MSSNKLKGAFHVSSVWQVCKWLSSPPVRKVPAAFSMCVRGTYSQPSFRKRISTNCAFHRTARHVMTVIVLVAWCMTGASEPSTIPRAGTAFRQTQTGFNVCRLRQRGAEGQQSTSRLMWQSSSSIATKRWIQLQLINTQRP